MTEIRRQLSAAFPRPRRHDGAVGHVAHLQQIGAEAPTPADSGRSGPAARPESPVDGTPDPAAAATPVGDAEPVTEPVTEASAAPVPADGEEAVDASAGAAVDAGAAAATTDDAGSAAGPVLAAPGAAADDGAAEQTPALADNGDWPAWLDHGVDLPTGSFEEADTVEIPLTGGDGGFFDPPPVNPPVEQPPSGRGRGRRLRVAALAGLLVAALGAAGVTYAVVEPQTSGHALPLPSTGASSGPVVTTPPTFRPGGVAGLDPANGASSAPPTSADPRPSETPSQDARRPGGTGGSDRGDDDRRNDWPPVAAPNDPDPGDPGSPVDPERPSDPSEEEPAAELVAELTRRADVVPLGLTGYRGTVRISNPATTRVTGWRVTLTLPGDNRIRQVEGAQHRQDGSSVVFTPDGETRTVPAGGSVTFTFRIRGVLPGEPTDCTIDGRPCA